MDSLCLENVKGRLVKVTETDGREFIGTVETLDGKRGVMAVLGNSSLENWHSNKYLNLFFRADVRKIHMYDHCPTREKREEKGKRRNDCRDLAETCGKADSKVEKVLDNQEDVNIHTFASLLMLILIYLPYYSYQYSYICLNTHFNIIVLSTTMLS